MEREGSGAVVCELGPGSLARTCIQSLSIKEDLVMLLLASLNNTIGSSQVAFFFAQEQSTALNSFRSLTLFAKSAWKQNFILQDCVLFTVFLKNFFYNFFLCYKDSI